MSDTKYDVDALLELLWDARGTDIMLTEGSPPRLRLDGRLDPVPDAAPLDGDAVDVMLAGLLTQRQAQAFEDSDHLDFSFSWRDLARIRGNAFRQRGATAVALRVIPRTIPSFDVLGLPQSVRDLAQLSQGLVLVTGPTGSGKSTTLASLVDWINRNRALHVITVEDPIEYVHSHHQSVVNQREVGSDATTFASALRAALREDPDVLLVGEMRDLESIRFALTLAETGHLVLATLHTNDTAQAVDRLVDVFPGDQQPQIRVQLAATLRAVVHQRLVPRLDGGMVAAHEVLVATQPVRALVKEGKTNQLRNQVLTGQRDGMQTLEMSLSRLVTEGLVSYDEAVTRSAHPRDVARG